MTSVQGCRRFQSVFRLKTYRTVIFLLRLAVICTIFVFRQYAVTLHPVVFSRPLKLIANIVIKDVLDNQLTVLQLHRRLRIVNKGPPVPPLPNLMNHKSKAKL